MSISTNSVCVRIGEKAVLDTVSFEVEPGHVIGLIGPNGAGKSTLINVLSGDIQPSSGSVFVDDLPLTDFTPAQLAKVRTVMSQASSIVFDFTVDEIIRMGWVQDDMYVHDVAEQAVREITSVCGISEFLERRYRTLSGGEQRRVQFARALLQVWRIGSSRDIRYLLLDEPTANLDIRHELAVLSLSREIASKRVGVLVVLHDLNLAARFTDELVLLSDGRAIATGPTEKVLDSNQLERVYKTPILVEHHSGLNRLVVHS